MLAWNIWHFDSLHALICQTQGTVMMYLIKECVVFDVISLHVAAIS